MCVRTRDRDSTRFASFVRCHPRHLLFSAFVIPVARCLSFLSCTTISTSYCHNAQSTSKLSMAPPPPDPSSSSSPSHDPQPPDPTDPSSHRISILESQLTTLSHQLLTLTHRSQDLLVYKLGFKSVEEAEEVIGRERGGLGEELGGVEG